MVSHRRHGRWRVRVRLPALCSGHPSGRGQFCRGPFIDSPPPSPPRTGTQAATTETSTRAGGGRGGVRVASAVPSSRRSRAGGQGVCPLCSRARRGVPGQPPHRPRVASHRPLPHGEGDAADRPSRLVSVSGGPAQRRPNGRKQGLCLAIPPLRRLPSTGTTTAKTASGRLCKALVAL